MVEAKFLSAWPAVLASLVLSVSAADLTQPGNIIVDPTSAPATLTLRGSTYTPGNTDAHGLQLSVLDELNLDEEFGSTPMSIGAFTLLRPHGTFSWQHAAEAPATVEVTMMELSDDHSLTLYNPDPAASGAWSITLRPGPPTADPLTTGGLLYNGERLLTSVESSLAIGGGSISGGTFVRPDWWPAFFPPYLSELFGSPGTLAVGDGAKAFGPDSYALGEHAQAGSYALALGPYATATGYSVALGGYSTASKCGTAIGDSSKALGFHAMAICGDAYSDGIYSLAMCEGYAGNWYSTAISANASGPHSFAAAWGNASGDSSIALGGTAVGLKSFAGNSGYAVADYSTSLGRGTITRRLNQVALGTYNLDPAWRTGTLNQDQTVVDGDQLFIIGNGYVEDNGAQHRSDAFTVGYNGDTHVTGTLNVDGGVSVKGVLRVPESGDLSMGDFHSGTQP